MSMFETAMFFDAMENLCKSAHDNAKAKGFWDGDENRNIPTKIALIHSELSELLEAFRSGPQYCGKPCEILCKDGVRPLTAIEEEIADVMIRLADLCGFLGVDLGRVTLAKMEYNAKRPQMHGGKKF